MKRLLAAATVFVTACSLDLGVPSDVVVICTNNTQCPSGTICDTNVGQCVASETPSLSVDVPDELATRYTRQVPFSVTVVSANAEARFDLQIEFRMLDEPAGSWRVMTFALESDTTTGVAGSPSGNTYDFVWDALADAVLANGVQLARVDLDGDGLVAEPIVRGAGVSIRAVARNASGSVRSVPAESPPFEVGNLPPSAQILDVIGESGVITVVLGLTDTSSDPCGMELQFKITGDSSTGDVWRNAELAYGTTAGLGCQSGAPLNASVGWSSVAPLLDHLVVPPSTPQGIGTRTLPSSAQPFRVSLRARAYDQAEASAVEQHWGVWSPVRVLDRVVNQSAPLIVSPVAPRASITAGTSAVHIRYTLVDGQADPIDVELESSSDGGASWIHCDEYPYSLSEGTTGLASAPLASDGSGGVEHLFSWDASRVTPAVAQSTLLRITARDGVSSPTTVSFGLGSPAGATGQPPHDSFAHVAFSRNLFRSDGTTNASVSRDVAMADFNADGRKDLAFAQPVTGTGATTSVVHNLGATVPWSTVTYPTGGAFIQVAAGDFTANGIQSLFGVAQNGTATLLVGNNAFGFAAEPTFNVGGEPFEIVASDLDADGDADLVMLVETGVEAVLLVYMNGEAAGPRFGAPTFSKTYPLASFAVGDLSGDGFPDIAVAGQSATGEVLGGDGAGDFEVIGDFEANTGFDDQSLAIGDVNGDSLPDVINAYSNTLVYLISSFDRGRVFFTRYESSAVPGSIDFVRAADLNGDGLTDAVLSSSLDGVFVVALSAVDPVNGAVVPRFGQVAQVNLGVFADDLDGDNIAELVAFTGNGTASYALLTVDNITTPNAQPFRKAPSSFPEDGGGAPLIANIDADGVPDLVYVNRSLLLHRGVGGMGVSDATFGVEEEIFIDPTAFDQPRAAFADLNGDGVLDIVILVEQFLQEPVPHRELQLYWTLGRTSQGVSDARFAQAQLLDLGVGQSGSSGTMIQTADFDRDGSDDIAWVYSDDEGATWNVGVAFSRGASGFVQRDASYALPAQPANLGTGYIGADALPDLVVAISATSQVRLLDNTTTPVVRTAPFTASTIALAGPAGDVDLADLDWDGVSDLIIRYGTSIEMRNGIAAGGFGGAINYFPNDSFASLSYFDATFDGINDFLFTGVASTVVSALTPGLTAGGVPNNTFVSTISTYVGRAAEVMWERDLNCDGAADYVESTGNLEVFAMARERDAFTPTLSMAAPPYKASQPRRLASLGFPSGVPAHAWHVAAGGPCSERGRWEDDLRQARARAGTTPRFRVLTTPRWLGETTRFKKTQVGDSLRLRQSSRFSPPLDLATEGSPRGLVPSLTVFPARRASVVPAKLKVYVQVEGLTLASEVPLDPLHDQPGGAVYLPQVVTSRGLTDVVRRNWRWETIPVDADGNLTTGTGRRYVYDATRGRVDILTDTGGLYVVVEEP